MLLKASTKSITAASVTLLIALSLILADSVKTYEINGWCLSYDPSQLPEGAQDITIPGSFPTLLVPAPSLSRVSDDPAARVGLKVSFSKGSSEDLNWRISRRSHLRSGCEYLPIDSELSQIVDLGARNCSLNSDRDHFVVDMNEGSFSGVELQCSHNELISTCRVLDIYETGWRATIWLPKTEFENWKAAISDTRLFSTITSLIV